MNLSKKLILSSTLIWMVGVVYSQPSSSCTTDYQCNTGPYGQCSGSFSDCSVTQPGIAVDVSSNTVFYAVQCRDSSDPYGNITIKQVSANGGVAQTVYSEYVNPAPGNIGKILAAANGYVYYDRSQRAPGTLLYAYVVSSGENKALGSSGFFQSELDITNGETYSVNLVPGPNGLAYEIDRYTAVVGQSTSGTSTKLYNIPAIPGPVRKGAGADVIFAIYTLNASTYTTTFYRGTTTGSESLPSSYFVVDGYVNDFDVDVTGSVIVYGNSTGLFKRVGSTTTKLSSESIIGVYILNNKVIYNNGFTVRSANIDGTGISDIVKAASGKCTCKNGFAGSNCQTCSDGQVQWNNGAPSCVPLNSQGFPATCSYDYQCGNVPYTLCTGTCTCRENFTGKKCDQCAAPRTITWSNGIPYCS